MKVIIYILLLFSIFVSTKSDNFISNNSLNKYSIYNLSRLIQGNNVTNTSNNISEVSSTIGANTTSNSTTDDNEGDNSEFGKMVNYCNSLTEKENPKILDCTSVNIHCCWANYSIMSYYFTTCFYNELQDNTLAKTYFEDAIGSISNSPFMEYSVKCSTDIVSFWNFINVVLLIIYFV